VKFLSANAGNIAMQISTSQSVPVINKCRQDMPATADLEPGSKQAPKDSTCCSDSFQDCQNCNHCPQTTSMTSLSAKPSCKSLYVKSHHNLTPDVLHNDSVVQENLLRPPRNSI